MRVRLKVISGCEQKKLCGFGFRNISIESDLVPGITREKAATK